MLSRSATGLNDRSLTEETRSLLEKMESIKGEELHALLAKEQRIVSHIMADIKRFVDQCSFDNRCRLVQLMVTEILEALTRLQRYCLLEEAKIPARTSAVPVYHVGDGGLHRVLLYLEFK